MFNSPFRAAALASRKPAPAARPPPENHRPPRTNRAGGHRRRPRRARRVGLVREHRSQRHHRRHPDRARCAPPGGLDRARTPRGASRRARGRSRGRNPRSPGRASRSWTARHPPLRDRMVVLEADIGRAGGDGGALRPLLDSARTALLAMEARRAARELIVSPVGGKVTSLRNVPGDYLPAGAAVARGPRRARRAASRGAPGLRGRRRPHSARPEGVGRVRRSGRRDPCGGGGGRRGDRRPAAGVAGRPFTRRSGCDAPREHRARPGPEPLRAPMAPPAGSGSCSAGILPPRSSTPDGPEWLPRRRARAPEPGRRRRGAA